MVHLLQQCARTQDRRQGGYMSKSKKRMEQIPVLHPDAAGVDIGADEIFVAVPADRDAKPVRSFLTFTRDLNDLVGWLQRCGIRTVAMESTSVYWIPLYQLLEERGMDVCLVNAQYVRNVPGRKTDVSDCQWIQYLHSVGLLRASFRPAADICAIRSLWRHRGSLIEMAAEHVLHIQKALDQMNLQIHRVLSDITGQSGQRILDAIVNGQRDPLLLARLCHARVKSLISEVDQEIGRHLTDLRTASDAGSKPPTQTKKTKHRRQHHEPTGFDLRSELYRIFGVDLTDVPGISAVTAHTILCEVGTDLTRFRSASAFASWLGLCPEKQISGGRVLYTKSRRVKSRIALALRIGANSLHHAKNYLGEFFRRIVRRLGKAQAITATAHKLARIVYHLLTTKDPYKEDVFQVCEEEMLRHAESRLRKHAAHLGFTLVPAATR
jgi:transposase